MARNFRPLLVIAASVLVCACAPDAPTKHAAPPASPGPARCEALAGTQIGIGVIDKSHAVASGDQLLGLLMRVLIRVAVPELPRPVSPADFCRVTAKLHPAAGSEITAEIWLPHAWNGKFVAGGGNGFNGGLGVGPFVMVTPMARGYATMVTDAGHEDTESAKFAHDSKEQWVDYAWRANHVAAAFAKELIARYYAAPVKRAYFQGCSNGGRDALMEARRFPEDYDGIIAGAPAAAWSRLMTSFAWNHQVLAGEPMAQDLGKKLKLVQDAVIARCDALDGVRDQLLENPRHCAFDPGELQCRGGNGPDCLNAGEVAVLRKLYAGPRLADGSQLFPGMPVGGEGLPKNWEDWITAGKDPKQGNFALETFRWMVSGKAEWDLSSFKLDADYLRAKEHMAALMDSDDPDLGAYVKRGGKLLLYHGWNDGGISANATVEYYESLRKNPGVTAEQNVRLFMVPGMVHCTGGVGPNAFDALEAMDHWVEGQAAPERIIASELDPPLYLLKKPGARVVRTRPLCPWPQAAHYSGAGSTDDAANFTCQ